MGPLVRALGRRRGTLLGLAVGLAASAMAWAALPPRPRLSWRGPEVPVCIAPDGSRLFTQGRSVSYLRGTSGRGSVALSPSPGIGVHHSTFSSDGRFLLAEVGSDEFRPVWTQALKVWDTATGRERHSFPYVGDLMAYPNYALSGDGRTLAFGDNSGRLPMRIESAELIFDGRDKVTRYFNTNPGLPRVKVMDLDRGREIGVFRGRPLVALSADGKLLASAAPDWHVCEITAWDVASGRLRETLDLGQGNYPGPMAFSPDGKLLAVNGRAVSVWDLATKQRLAITGKGDGDQPPVFRWDGRLLFPIGLPKWSREANMNRDFACWNLAASPPRRLALPSGDVAISPDGRSLALTRSHPIRQPGTGYDSVESTVTLLDLPSLEERHRLVVQGKATTLLAPDGRTLALLVDRYEGPGARSGVEEWLRRQFPWAFPRRRAWRTLHRIELIDPSNGRSRGTIPLPEIAWDRARLEFSRDGRTLIVVYTRLLPERPSEGIPADGSPTVEVWDVPTRRPLGSWLGISAVGLTLGPALGWWRDRRRARRATALSMRIPS